MRYRKCNDTYKRSLRKVLIDSYRVFEAPRYGIPSAVEEVGQVLRECITLGIQIPWDLTGREVILTLKRQGFSDYVHPLLEGGPNPEDSAPYFLNLLSVIESCFKDVKDINGMGGPTSMWRNDTCPYVYNIQKDDNTSQFEIIRSPNPTFNPNISSKDGDRNVPIRTAKVPTPHSYQPNSSILPIENAKQIQNNDHESNQQQQNNQNGTTNMTLLRKAQGCRNPPNQRFSFCVTCHEVRKVRGFIICKDGTHSKVIKSKHRIKSPKPNPHKRSFGSMQHY